MTATAPLPTEVRQWVEERLYGLVTIADVSGPRANSRVWHVASDTAEAYVKISPSAEAHARERRPLKYGRDPRTTRAPQLLAAKADLLTIMTSPLPGVVVRDLTRPTDTERRVHELAGSVLRRWHDACEPVPDQARADIRASISSQANDAFQCLERTTGHLGSAESRLLQEVARPASTDWSCA